ncbi:hypothetical protein Tco_1018810 [Tanacetum coccineum]|uniref:Uncharacterized protein n=1 Tax=Tanacetum coccineum TaxID=301880 RepID=A0ABQ5FVL5_9ASTR
MCVLHTLSSHHGVSAIISEQGVEVAKSSNYSRQIEVGERVLRLWWTRQVITLTKSNGYRVVGNQELVWDKEFWVLRIRSRESPYNGYQLGLESGWGHTERIDINQITFTTCLEVSRREDEWSNRYGSETVGANWTEVWKRSWVCMGRDHIVKGALGGGQDLSVILVEQGIGKDGNSSMIVYVGWGVDLALWRNSVVMGSEVLWSRSQDVKSEGTGMMYGSEGVLETLLTVSCSSLVRMGMCCGEWLVIKRRDKSVRGERIGDATQ